MSAVNFTPLAVPRRYPDKVQLHAVLVPCFGRDADELLRDDDKVKESALELVTLWRRRVHALADAGWAGMCGDGPTAVRNRTFAGNCLPTFVLTAETTRCCRRREVCPFCRARQVREVWLSVDHAFFADQFVGKAPAGGDGLKPTRFRRANFDLVEHADVLTFPKSIEVNGETTELLPAILKQTIGRRSGTMKSLMKVPGMRGAFETLHVASTRDGSWRVEARKLFMVEGSFVVPKSYAEPIPVKSDVVPSAAARLERIPNPRRIDVLNAVARVCRYPTFLLRGDPKSAVAAFRAREGLKLSEAYGAFRNKAIRRRSAGR